MSPHGDTKTERPRRLEVYWITPFAKQRESQSVTSLAEAKKTDSLIRRRLKLDKESFRPAGDAPNTGGTCGKYALYLNAKQFTPKNMQNMIEHLRPVLEVFGRREINGLDAF